MSISRREFVIESAVIAGGIALARTESSAEAAALPTRLLGRTKERLPLLAFGTAPLGSDNTTPEEAAKTMMFALKMGVTYWDTAPIYGDPKTKYGNAEMKLKEPLKLCRDKIFLVTKVNNSRQTRDGVLAQLEESLKRLGTDHVDACHIHNLGDFDMDKVFGPDGALAGLKEAKKRGMVRYIGTSGHMRPARFIKAYETGEIDLSMNTLNFADLNHYHFEQEVLPAARKHNVGIVAMKVLGGAVKWQYDGKTPGVFAEHYDQALRYSLGVPGVSCAVLGMANEEEVRRAVEAVRKFKPLSNMERSGLLEVGVRLAKGREEYYGPVVG